VLEAGDDLEGEHEHSLQLGAILIRNNNARTLFFIFVFSKFQDFQKISRLQLEF
jgi:hypothetical protein